MSHYSDRIGYEIYGAEMQYVEIILNPGDTAVAEAGALMLMEQGIEMETTIGDGSHKTRGVFGKVMGVGKRKLTGESLFMTQFTNRWDGPKRVAFSAPYPGRIIPLDLSQLGGRIVCQKEAFLCSARGIAVGIAFVRRITTGMFGGEGFIMQSLEGDGIAFIHAGGTVSERLLGPGECLYVDSGCFMAMQPSVDFQVTIVKGIKSIFFGGEGAFLIKLTGPGKVWVQSTPFGRIEARIFNTFRKLKKNKHNRNKN